MSEETSKGPRIGILSERGEELEVVALAPGRNRLGRAAGNEIVIEDPSVSGVHCELEWSDGTLRVRDFGSTNGTFVRDHRVEAADIPAGEIFRVGNVQLRLLPLPDAASPTAPVAKMSGAPGLRLKLDPTAAPSEPSSVTPADQPPSSQEHSELTAPSRSAPAASGAPANGGTLICLKCGGVFAREETKRYIAGNRETFSCTRCGGFCVDAAKHERELARENATFGQLLGRSFKYALRGDGRLLLILGGIFFGLLYGFRDFTGWIMKESRMINPVFIAAYLIATVLGTGYYFACLQGIIQSSANGEDEMPNWPEVSTFWDEIFLPFFRFSLVFILSLGPGLVIQSAGFTAAGFAIMLLGFFALPMTLLSVAMSESIGGLNPIIVFSGIARIPGQYVVTCLVILTLLIFAGLLRFALELTGILFVPGFLAGFVELYASCTAARILGCLYYANRRVLGWF